MHQPQIAAIDAWITSQRAEITRPEAIRRLVELGLRTSPDAAEYQAKANESAGKARKLAGELGLKAKPKV